LSNLGLSSLVAYTPDEFIAIAVAWARDLPRLSRLRAQLRARLEASPLMNAPRFAESVAAAYRSMWERWSTMNS
jgi:predicted O-linked N-acetylglucosamine transferase (SPINDLY family)